MSTPELSVALRLERACDRFEAAWRQGRPALEDHLAGWRGPERAELLRQLLLLDLDYRRGRGEACRAEDYRGRFPDLDPAWLADALSGDSLASAKTAEV